MCGFLYMLYIQLAPNNTETNTLLKQFTLYIQCRRAAAEVLLYGEVRG